MSAREWIKCEDAMPRSGVAVLAFYRTSHGKGRTVRAEYAAASTLPVSDEQLGEFGSYDEETDTYYCPEGWYEMNEHEECHWGIEEKVTHWRPMPAPPEVDAGRVCNLCSAGLGSNRVDFLCEECRLLEDKETQHV